MYIMKKRIFLALLTTLYFLFPLSPRKARADGAYAYAYVPTESVYFYSDFPDPSLRQGLFRLPCSYYVRVLSEEGEYLRVEYLTDGSKTKKITGYCKKSELVLVDYIPEMPYLYLDVDITYTLSSGKDETFSTITISCAYYGDYTDGTKVYSYVLRENVFGYVLKPSHLRYERNTEYDDRKQSDEPVLATPSKDKSALSVGQITLLVLLCLLIPCLAALIVRPSSPKPPYEE